MVRVVGPDGNQLGVMPISEALRAAREQELDLVEVASRSNPPVVRIMDYGKYKYEQSKRDQRAKKRQHQTVVKEVKLRPKIEEHDFRFKMKHAEKFLKERDKVKFTVMFRGRELSHAELGHELLADVVEALAEIGQVENRPQMEGRTLTMLMAPKSGAAPAKAAKGTKGSEKAPKKSGAGSDSGSGTRDRAPKGDGKTSQEERPTKAATPDES